MVKNIGYSLIFGKPVLFYLGIVTFLSFLFTALVGSLNMKGNHRIPLKWHYRMAFISLGLALIHGILAGIIYL
jgi:hypothetical protein